MKTLALLFSTLCFSVSAQITGPELLNKAIDYHDPNGNWPTFQGTLSIDLTMAEGKIRKSEVTIDLASERFELSETTDVQITRSIKGNDCRTTLNGSPDFSSLEKEKHKLTCERTLKMRDYYTYLYGLPMKLKDPGTIVDNEVIQREFQGTIYNVLKVTYNANVGEDTWYFYFDTKTNEMQLYQFFHDEEKNDGEYILLSDIIEFNGMKIPKERKWFTNKENKYLGTDVLVSCRNLN